MLKIKIHAKDELDCAKKAFMIHNSLKDLDCSVSISNLKTDNDSKWFEVLIGVSNPIESILNADMEIEDFQTDSVEKEN